MKAWLTPQGSNIDHKKCLSVYITWYWLRRPGTASLLTLKRYCKSMITSLEVLVNDIGFYSINKGLSQSINVFTFKESGSLSYTSPIQGLITIFKAPYHWLALLLCHLRFKYLFHRIQKCKEGTAIANK